MRRQDNRYNDEVRLALSYAREEALRLRHRLVSNEHLLLGILRLDNSLVEGLFVSLHTSPTMIAQALDFVVGRGRRAHVGEPSLSSITRATLVRAEGKAQAMHAEQIGVEHILFGLFDEQDSTVIKVLESLGINADNARQRLETLLQGGHSHLLSSIKYRRLYDTTPHLNQVGRDLTLEALEGTLDPLIGRENELEHMMQILSRRSKNNPVLIGPAGVGKTALAEGLALRIMQERVTSNLLNCRIVALDVGLLTSGTRFRGDLEDRMKAILQELVNQPNVILLIDELHQLVQTGVADGSLDIANLFKPLLARGEFRCIGATTLDEYRKTIEKDPALERRFQPVLIREPNEHETLNILYGLRSQYETFHRVTIQDDALHAAVQMSTRYIQGRTQPDKALDLLDEAAARVSSQRFLAPNTIHKLRYTLTSLQREKAYAIAAHDFPRAAALLKEERSQRQTLFQAEQYWYEHNRQQRLTVGVQDIAEIVVSRTGIPLAQCANKEQGNLLQLEQELQKHVIGQHTAIQAVAKAIRRSHVRIRNERRPIGSFLFAGPVGVGKTELARALANVLFGSQQALLKLDMTDFTEYHHISRLIGAPPGYVGYEQAGQLTEYVRRRPYSIILFDEIEKAHPKVIDILLQILEDGRLCDTHNRSVDFSHTVIIMTSNIGTAQQTASPMQFVSQRWSEQELQDREYETLSTHVLTALRNTFRPEWLNRIDEIIVFHALSSEHIGAIVDIMVEQTRQKLLTHPISLEVTERARSLIAKKGYNRADGARHLRRVVQHLLDDALADAILQGHIAKGDAVIIDA